MSKPIKINLKAETAGSWKSYPRLMQNKRGEVLLAINKDSKSDLTTGILLSSLDETWPPGKVWTDWEVVGELIDYDGVVEVILQNNLTTAK